MKVRKTLALISLVASTLALSACDDSAKKAEEAAKVAADKAAAEKATAEAKAKEDAAKAEATAKAAFETSRAQVKKATTAQGEALDRKATYLKEKAGKLTGPAKAKATAAMDSFDKARTDLTKVIADVDATTSAKMDETSAKAKSAAAAAQTALDDFEAAVTGKAKDGGK